ncbi:hypothetical protein AAEO57_08580 [Flavobacterium sp. DGU38]|uniref:ParB/Sulfiredoxin domain-containing protein n=1 Tax=Flavobacterium calami TaxID=3139144 RepID=A0ABU9IN24_9FLAO
MIVEVSRGQNIIRILSDSFLSCLIVKQALVVNWPDCRGSVGEYYAISNFASEDRYKLTNKLDSVLINGNEDQILESITSFLDLFSNGKYEIFFNELNLKKCSFHHENQVIYSESVPEIEKFSNGFYPFPFENEDYFFTILKKDLNLERIEYYIDLIEKGIRPKIIVFESYNINTGYYSSSYILDGHHKLSAYLKLGINIPAVWIRNAENEEDNTEEILKYIKPILKDFEYDHIIKNNK